MLAAAEREEIGCVDVVDDRTVVVVTSRVDHREANGPLVAVKWKALFRPDVHIKIRGIAKTVGSAHGLITRIHCRERKTAMVLGKVAKHEFPEIRLQRSARNHPMRSIPRQRTCLLGCQEKIFERIIEYFVGVR